MADSNITKKALAHGLKELMSETSFEKINILDICNKCDMSRQSFYYHFKDKYDLVSWIYDTEFIEVVRQHSYDTGFGFLNALCVYMYQNKGFYCKAFKIKGQNAFSDHFREMLIPMLSVHMKPTFDEQKLEQTQIEFFTNFFIDAIICAIERWIQEKDCIPPEMFVGLIKSCMQTISIKIYNDMNS